MQSQSMMLTCTITPHPLSGHLFTMSEKDLRVEPSAPPVLVETKFKCSRCHRSFKRMEHLKRHRRTHDGTKRFVCPTCSKGFARSDILHRHELIHTVSLDDTMDTRRKRACLECAKARERCTKGHPCFRCSSRSLECTYSRNKSDVSTTSTSYSVVTASSQQLNSQSQTPQHESSGASNINASSPSSSYAEGSIDHAQQSSLFPAHWEQATIPITFPQAPMAVVSSDPLHTPPSLNIPSSLPGTYNPLSYMSASSPLMHSPHVYSTYSPAIASPISWNSTVETANPGYDSIADLGISTDGHYVDLTPSIQNGIMSPLFPVPNGSYPLTPWMKDPRFTQQDYSQARSQSVDSNVPRSVPFLSASPADNASTTSHFSADTTELTSPWADTFGSIFTSPRTPAYPDFPQKRPSQTIIDQEAFWMPPLADSTEVQLDVSSNVPQISQRVYVKTIQNFQRLCLATGSAYNSFLSVDFPSLGHLNLFVHLYFQNFDPVLPIIHPQKCDLDEFWPLALALSAIGCQYSKQPEFSACAGPLHEFLRRALAIELDSGTWSRQFIPVAQALVLSQIGSLYGGSSQPVASVRARHRTLVEIVESHGLLLSGNSHNIGNSIEESWQSWLVDETKRRLGYSIWLLDSMSTYHFGQRPLLCMDNAQCELPQAELWSSQTSLEWSENFIRYKKTETLSDTLCALRLYGNTASDLGGFGQLILLHGIYEDAFRSKGNFSPTTSARVLPVKRHGATLRSTTSIQRSSLECIEAMNQTATEGLGRTEPLGALHLAIARIVLLVPYESIQTIVKSIAAQHLHSTSTRSPASQAEKEVFRWTQQDKENARLAVVHCGLAFWHLKRVSCNGFYEPISAFLACITLWAYSFYASKLSLGSPKGTTEQFDTTQSGGIMCQAGPTGQPEPAFIQLDCPNDDELVQLFAKSGTPSAMQAHITGVGNIFAPSGPSNILKEGRRILASVSTVWDRTQEYASILEALERNSMESVLTMA